MGLLLRQSFFLIGLGVSLLKFLNLTFTSSYNSIRLAVIIALIILFLLSPPFFFKKKKEEQAAFAFAKSKGKRQRQVLIYTLMPENGIEPLSTYYK